MQYQIDFGNLTVGIATILIAAATFFVAKRTSTSANAQKVADFRRDWVEKLRDRLVSFSDAILRESLSANATQIKITPSEYAAHLFSISREMCAVELMLNPNEKAHADLLGEMRRSMDLKESNEASLVEFRRLARIVLKTEWDKLRDDLLGPKRKDLR